MKMSIARILPLALAAAVLAMPAPAAASAHITIVNADGPNEGFNDPTPAAPVGGNPGTTKGQQRLIAFQFAADLWGAALDSNIDIQIRARLQSAGAERARLRRCEVLSTPTFRRPPVFRAGT